MYSFLRRILVCATMLVVFFKDYQAHAIIHFYETGVPPGLPTTPECAEAGHVLQHYLAEFPHPPQWTFVVCDDKAWDNVMHLDGMDDVGKDVFGTISLLRDHVLAGAFTGRQPANAFRPLALCFVMVEVSRDRQ